MQSVTERAYVLFVPAFSTIGCKLRITSKPVVCCVTEEFRRLTNAMGDTKTENVFRKFKKN